MLLRAGFTWSDIFITSPAIYAFLFYIGILSTLLALWPNKAPRKVSIILTELKGILITLDKYSQVEDNLGSTSSLSFSKHNSLVR